MENLKFAVVGLGHIGKVHAELLQSQVFDADLVAVCDSDSSHSRKYSVPFFNSIENLFASSIKIDVVCVCTPSGLHAKHAIFALRRGCHVVCEKPLAISSDDCRKMISVAKECGKTIFCVMQNRFSASACELRKIIDDGVLGKIFMVQTNCFWNRGEQYYKIGSWHGSDDLDGGSLFTQFSHFIDTILWLFGDMTNLQTSFRNFNHKNLTSFCDSGFVTFDLPNDAIGSFNFTTSVSQKNLESSITVIGEKGTIQVKGQYLENISYCINDYIALNIGRDNKSNHCLVLQNVTDYLSGKSAKIVTAQEGLRVVETIEKMYKS